MIVVSMGTGTSLVQCDKEGITKYNVEKTLMDFSDEMPKIKEKIKEKLGLQQ